MGKEVGVGIGRISDHVGGADNSKGGRAPRCGEDSAGKEVCAPLAMSAPVGWCGEWA